MKLTDFLFRAARAASRRTWQDVTPEEASGVIGRAVERGEWRRLLDLDELELLAELAQVTCSFGFSGRPHRSPRLARDLERERPSPGGRCESTSAAPGGCVVPDRAASNEIASSVALSHHRIELSKRARSTDRPAARRRRADTL